MNGTIKQVRSIISSWERGRIFFLDDFATLDSPGSVRIGLSQLVVDGFILRLARGIYCYPKVYGEYSIKYEIPDPEIVAYALAAKERVRIIPYGDQAAYKLGLTGLRVSELMYLTDGAPRKISLSKGKRIYFNHTSEVKIFDYCNDTMQMMASAIRALGSDRIGERELRILREHVKKVPEREFNRDIVLPPAWVQEILLGL